jgi:hypothetical protein
MPSIAAATPDPAGPAAAPATVDSTRFYEALPLNTLPLSQLMGERLRFADVPADWHVVITDVKKSTQALSNGMHHLVNLVATGSIIAALNIARRADTRVPFFFGGDGATLIVPDTLVVPILLALNQHRENTQRNFGLDLRVGSVPVAAIYATGHTLSIAKAQMTDAFTIPVMLGHGIQHAEAVIKGEGYMPELPQETGAALNLDGMECRWDSIRPPEDSQAVLCLLVTIEDASRQGEICSDVLKALDDIFGPPQSRSPVAIERLRLKPTLGRIIREMRARLGKFDLAYLLETWLRTLIGFIYLRYVKAGQNYLRGVAQLSDTLVIDGRINTIIAGTARQRAQLVDALRRMEARGDIHYGIHVCAESVMSCYVRDRANDHIHFIDGIGGGYTLAATELKRKLGKA